jgi:hypothetical protein
MIGVDCIENRRGSETMTESDWLASGNPRAMVTFIRDERMPFRTRWLSWVGARRFTVSDRKWRHIAAAVIRSVADLLPEEQAEPVLPVLARWADEEISHDGAVTALKPVTTALRRSVARGTASMAVTMALLHLPRDADPSEIISFATAARAKVFRVRGIDRLLSEPITTEYRKATEAFDVECVRQADLVRCILGNPFRTALLDPVYLDANDGAARRVAQEIYDDHAFADLPVLADALEDAGCTDDAALSHCRDAGPHARGCWVVDLALGKQ